MNRSSTQTNTKEVTPNTSYESNNLWVSTGKVSEPIIILSFKFLPKEQMFGGSEERGIWLRRHQRYDGRGEDGLKGLRVQVLFSETQ